MKVTVTTERGELVQGAFVRVNIEQSIVLGVLVPPYSVAVTTDQRGEALVPNPGVLGMGQTADIVSRVTLNGKEYSYYGAVQANVAGAFPKEYTMVLSRESELPDVGNVYLAALENVKWIAAAGAVIIVGWSLRGVLNKPRRL